MKKYLLLSQMKQVLEYQKDQTHVEGEFLPVRQEKSLILRDTFYKILQILVGVKCYYLIDYVHTL